MKNTLSAYENTIRNYLKRYNFPEAEDESFITCRAENTYEVFCDARRRGIDVPTSDELAKIVLFQDLDITFDDVIRDILAEEFYDDLPEYEYDNVIADMEYLLEEYRELYDITPEFMATPEWEAMKTELTGIIAQFINGNGL